MPWSSHVPTESLKIYFHLAEIVCVSAAAAEQRCWAQTTHHNSGRKTGRRRCRCRFRVSWLDKQTSCYGKKQHHLQDEIRFTLRTKPWSYWSDPITLNWEWLMSCWWCLHELVMTELSSQRAEGSCRPLLWSHLSRWSGATAAGC